MKRQSSVTSFFTSGAGASKKIKINEVADVSLSSSEHSNRSDVIVPNDKASMSRDVSNNLAIWSDSQRQYFMNKYPWLEITDRDHVGCNTCAQITPLTVDSNKHVRLFSVIVVSCGCTKAIHQASIHKELHEHQISLSHSKAVQIIEEGKLDKLATVVDKSYEKHLQSTVNVFNTLLVYSLIKRNRPMLDITDEIELQKKNGLNLGISLHSRQMAMSVGKHFPRVEKINFFQNNSSTIQTLYHY
jgi:hypothetical protein